MCKPANIGPPVKIGLKEKVCFGEQLTGNDASLAQFHKMLEQIPENIELGAIHGALGFFHPTAHPLVFKSVFAMKITTLKDLPRDFFNCLNRAFCRSLRRIGQNSGSRHL